MTTTEDWVTPLIRLKDIKKTYLMGKVPVNALRGLDLEIHDGEMSVGVGN